MRSHPFCLIVDIEQAIPTGQLTPRNLSISFSSTLASQAYATTSRFFTLAPGLNWGSHGRVKAFL